MSKIKICVDPGHGGYDSGALGNGLKEKDLTLKTGLALQKLLQNDGRFEVVMTRTGDYAPGHFENQLARELYERAKIANDFGADFFVAIHFNSSNMPNASGCETLVFQNKGIVATFSDSLLKLIHNNTGIPDRGVQVTGTRFAVIRETKMPSVITESAFINNATDISHFTTQSQLDQLAQYHYEAILAAFGLPKETVKNEPVYKPVKVDIDGKSVEDGIDVNGVTYVDVSLVPSGLDLSNVPSVKYMSKTFVPWAFLGKDVKPQDITGGFNFVIHNSPPVDPQPSPAPDPVVVPTPDPTPSPDPVVEPVPSPVRKPAPPVPVFNVPTPISMEQAILLVEEALKYLKGENK